MSTGKVIGVVLATVVIFAAGLVTGAVLVQQRVKPPLSARPVYFNRFEAAQRAVNQLDLTPAQRARIERIIHDSQDRIADYFQILEPDIRDAFRRMRDNIRAELTPEQRRLFEERMQRWRRITERSASGANLPLGQLRASGPNSPSVQPGNDVPSSQNHR